MNDSAVSVVVETATQAMAKLAEMAESDGAIVTAKDLLGKIIDLTTLQAEAAQEPGTP